MLDLIQKQLKGFQKEHSNQGRLLISCPDRTGIVAAVSQFLDDHNCNIIESSQYSTNPTDGLFFIRIVFECLDPHLGIPEIKASFIKVAVAFSMEWELNAVSHLKKIALMVSKELHCLQELLWEWQSGNLKAELALVISNHEEARALVESYGLPFYYIPANKAIRDKVEAKQKKLVTEYDVDLIVLARYMQILTADFVEAYPHRMINIHHSFLPAFVGAKPYERAYQRGVKLIGATSHYVTPDLDEGPIIEQGIMRVDHRDQIEDLKKIGRTVERSVLARAVKWHLEDRLIVHQNKTIVFN